MTKLFLFADEAGDFTFNRNQNVSIFYIICTVTMRDCGIGHSLLKLRRDLAWDKVEIGDYFHASTDRQAVRDHVFNVISACDFDIHATIMEKPKAQPQVRATEQTFYKYGWHYHFRYSSKKYVKSLRELHLTIASIGTKKKKIDFEDAVRDVVRQKDLKNSWHLSFWPCQSDPCLWVADYCTWAIQRKYESSGRDLRSYNLIADKIVYEYDLWEHGNIYY
ncbi:DUF3800 domain-containing protein [Methylosinus sp. R-45379]|uniref:DUF3800 domain-containing protein n=1 Tax=Methylosinus sp. R-45379 TaxID=980563 RepID=UPI000B276A56|nr:DUF3800 domain-containing protein [Methylosinus sp. R-45379]